MASDGMGPAYTPESGSLEAFGPMDRTIALPVRGGAAEVGRAPFNMAMSPDLAHR